MYSAKDIAKYFLALYDADEGDVVSNLQLQKLLFYAQGFFLAIHKRPLFKDAIEAWVHGPVVKSVYREYAKYDSAIPTPQGFDLAKIDKETRGLLDEIFRVYGQYSAHALARMTREHMEKSGSYGGEPGSVFSRESMKSYFKTLILEKK